VSPRPRHVSISLVILVVAIVLGVSMRVRRTARRL
jgi:hypothetical protein